MRTFRFPPLQKTQRWATRASGLLNVVASLALLWAEIDLAEGKTTPAATWLVSCRVRNATLVLALLKFVARRTHLRGERGGHRLWLRAGI